MSQTDRLYGLVAGAAIKVPCRAATTGNIALSAEQTIDGVAIVTGDRVLVKNQTDQTENGIWIADTGDWERAKDFDGQLDVVQGTLVTVVYGTTQSWSAWRVTTVNPIEIEGSNITFASALFNDAALVSFIAAGAGAVQRTAQNKMRDIVSVKDYGAVGDGVTDDTTAIQACIDQNLCVYFPDGFYAVTSITTTLAGQILHFDNAYLKGIAAVATTAILRIRKGQSTFNDVKIYGNYNLNYTAAMRVDAASAADYPGKCNWKNLSIYATKIGVLIGATSAPVDAPVSENHIVGGDFRDVERCFYVNQPNGFFNITNMTVDCQKYEWDLYHPGSFSYTVSAACEIVEGWMMFTNCEFLKGQTSLGSLLINADTLTVTGCNGECAATNFYGQTGGMFYVDGYRCNYFNNTTSAFIEFASSSTGEFKATNMRYARGANGEASTVGLIDSNAAAVWNCDFVNCVFENQNMPALLDSDNHYSTTCSVRFNNCYTKDVTYGTRRLGTSEFTAVPALLNLPVGGVGAAPPAAQYQVTVGGTSILVETDAGDTFNQCIDMIAGAGNNQLFTYPAAGTNWPYEQKSGVLEWYQKVVAGANGFNGSIIIYYYDSGTLLTTYTLATGTVGNVPSGNTAAIGWTKNQLLLPHFSLKATTCGVEFRQAATSQRWKVAGIRVY